MVPSNNAIGTNLVKKEPINAPIAPVIDIVIKT